jgi:isoleucyl-tRNA synthetase
MTATTDKQQPNVAPKGDYRRTLNITLNDKDPGAFPQRGNLPAREPMFQERWEAMDLYSQSLRKPAPRGTYVLHDGPPYSNGDIHLGHALNKVAKDIVTRYKTMQGYCAPYVPGWDNHGMPIENAVARRFREKKQTPDRVTLRKACRDYAADWVKVQRDQFKRLGIRGDWEKPYLTMSAEFEAKIVEVFGELAAQGFIYRGLKPVFWCATCETALADAEVEYEPHTSDSIYVRFPLYYDPNGVFDLPDAAPVTEGHTGEGVPAYVVIWTTTPWTIPANLAVAVHPDAEYAVVRAVKDEQTAYYLVAVPLAASAMQVAGVTQYETVKTVHGAALAGLVFRHPLFHRTSPVVLADYVTMDTGTGIVHTAPGHGKEDFETGVKYGLEVLNPVDNSGRYTAQAGEYDGQSFQGLRVTTTGDKPGQDSEANVALIAALRKSGNLLSATRFEHSYPHCWRCHSPLIFRATVQWFMNIDHEVEGEPFRQRALKAIADVTWHPKESVNRITTMVANRPDWCVSRQRSWGVGIPAFYCNHCGEHILTPESVAAVVALVRSQSSDAWYAVPAADILPAGFTCPHCGSGVDQLRKETDVLDVWFDSGSTNRAVLENAATWPDLHWPADLYLEGGDQHRGWFNSSLMVGVGTKGVAPYKAVVTNGWTLDENGEAFSKSKGNGVNPLDVVKNYGADVVRWWVVSQNFMEDTRCGENLLKQVGEMYRRVRNTFRFLVNNLYDFDPAVDAVPQTELEELDAWALVQLRQLVQTCTAAYESFEFHKVYQQVLNFCAVELSAFYLDVLKDRLYASGAKSRERRSAQTAMHILAETLARLLAPVLVHTAEEVWDHLQLPAKPASVHLAEFPVPDALPAQASAFWDKLAATRDIVKAALENARQSGVIGNPLEARVELNLDKNTYALFQPYEAQLPSLFLVSQVQLTANTDDELGVSARAVPAEGVKCARCWLIKTDVGVDAEYPDICGRCAAVLQA